MLMPEMQDAAGPGVAGLHGGTGDISVYKIASLKKHRSRKIF
jgi:hypothetical protein